MNKEYMLNKFSCYWALDHPKDKDKLINNISLPHFAGFWSIEFPEDRDRFEYLDSFNDGTYVHIVEILKDGRLWHSLKDNVFYEAEGCIGWSFYQGETKYVVNGLFNIEPFK